MKTKFKDYMKPDIRLVHKLYAIGSDILLVTGFKFESVFLRSQIQVGKHDKLRINNSSFLFICPFLK